MTHFISHFMVKETLTIDFCGFFHVPNFGCVTVTNRFIMKKKMPEFVLSVYQKA